MVRSNTAVALPVDSETDSCGLINEANNDIRSSRTGSGPETAASRLDRRETQPIQVLITAALTELKHLVDSQDKVRTDWVPTVTFLIWWSIMTL